MNQLISYVLSKNSWILNAFMLVILLGAALMPLTSQAQDAKEIVQKMEDNQRGDHVTQELTMTIVRPSWKRSIYMKSWGRGTEYSMIYITAPAKEKGQVFMKRKKEMWNWVPSIDRMIKLPPSMMMQSWMGSDFTNDDLIRESSIVLDYDHSIVGEETLQDRLCYKIQLIPKPEAAVVWGKLILWISKEGDLLLKQEFYDEDEYLVNTQIMSDIKSIGGRTIPCKLEMIPADEDGKKTVMQIEASDFNTDIKESFFAQQNMKRIR